MRLTVTLPSVNPDLLVQALDNLAAACVLEHEVVVVRPAPPPLLRARWVRDELMAGCNAGHAQALSVARGEFLFPWVDDHALPRGWDAAVVAEFEAREARTTRRPYMLGVRQAAVRPQVGTCFGVYYPYFPLVRTEDAEALGWYDGTYRVGFGDCDLAMRWWAAGGIAEWSAGTYATPLPEDGARKAGGLGYAPPDYARFVDRWAPVFGRTWGAGWRDLRDFNRDFDLATLADPAQRTFSPERRAF